MAITATRRRKPVSDTKVKGPNKREDVMLQSWLADTAIDSAGRWPGPKTACFVYDFAVDGGATGVITPSASCVIPANAIVLSAYIDTLTTVTSGGSATISIKCAATADTLAATGKASFVAGTVLTGLFQGTDTAGTGGAPAPLKLAADTTPTITVATAALTAGKFRVYFNYIYPNV